MKKLTQVDVAYETSLEDVLTDWGNLFPNVYFRIVERIGSGGGWPELEVVGSETDLAKFLEETGYDSEQIEWSLEEAIEI